VENSTQTLEDPNPQSLDRRRLIHLDLFSGIGGFSIASDYVFENIEHIFVEIDPFCQAVLKKHWPESYIHGDIKTFTNTRRERWNEGAGESIQPKSKESKRQNIGNIDLITGGFPCQPFSAAGRRQGTADDRYLWLEMFRVIREFKPTWVIAENVGGLVTWSEGMVLEQVCTDLEGEGYEVQPLIIPAVSVNAPHRRDRVWIIANRTSGRQWSSQPKGNTSRESEETTGSSNRDATNSGWNKNWIEVATQLCGVDDGLPAELDGLKLSKAAHRRERLKALGNAIVPQVAIEIMKGAFIG